MNEDRIDLSSFSPTTGTDGTFELSVAPGVYDIRAKGQHSLRVLLTSVDLPNEGFVPISLGVQTEGDYNGDNMVDVSDYSALIQSHIFGNLTASLSAADQLLDFNQDGVVDIGDYAMVMQNAGIIGVTPVGSPICLDRNTARDA